MALEKRKQSALERIGIMAVGHTAKQVEEWFFDYLLYPVVIIALGPLVGGAILTALSALLCLLYIVVYDYLKQDWLGLELLKEFRDGEEKKGRIGRMTQRFIRSGNIPAFLTLSVIADPFVVTAYLRKGAGRYNGLSRRDWLIFWSSVAVSNLYWIGFVSGAIEVAKWLWSALT